MLARSVSTRRRTDGLETRDRLVIENLTLVRAIAIRVHESLPVHVELDDLIHAGVLGLIDAVERYDASKNVSLQAYAKHRIKGAILDSLRQLDWASRDLRKRQKNMDEAVQELAARFGRTPTESEVAGRMGVSLDKWRKMTLELRNITVAPAPSHAEQERDHMEEFPATPEMRPDSICERTLMRMTLQRAIGTLPERYQKVVFLYYTNEMTMKEIGDVLGVNESRVSQIHKTALKRMAVALQSEGIRSANAL